MDVNECSFPLASDHWRVEYGADLFFSCQGHPRNASHAVRVALLKTKRSYLDERAAQEKTWH